MQAKKARRFQGDFVALLVSQLPIGCVWSLAVNHVHPFKIHQSPKAQSSILAPVSIRSTPVSIRSKVEPGSGSRVRWSAAVTPAMIRRSAKLRSGASRCTCASSHKRHTRNASVDMVVCRRCGPSIHRWSGSFVWEQPPHTAQPQYRQCCRRSCSRNLDVPKTLAQIMQPLVSESGIHCGDARASAARSGSGSIASLAASACTA